MNAVLRLPQVAALAVFFGLRSVCRFAVFLGLRSVCRFAVVLLAPVSLQAAGIASSDNFVVLTPAAPTQAAGQKFADAVLARAEALRKNIALEWLGEELPIGAGETIININFSDAVDHGVTWVIDSPKIKSHKMYLTTSRQRALGSTLAHETTHVVLSTKFGYPNFLPDWVEEGIASRYDDPKRRQRRQKWLRDCVRTGRWPDVERVLEAEKIIGFDSSGYIVAESIVEFLLARGNKPTLFRFAQAGRQNGWRVALKRHYKLRDPEALQQAWQGWVTDRAAGPRTAENGRSIVNR